MPNRNPILARNVLWGLFCPYLYGKKALFISIHISWNFTDNKIVNKWIHINISLISGHRISKVFAVKNLFNSIYIRCNILFLMPCLQRRFRILINIFHGCTQQYGNGQGTLQKNEWRPQSNRHELLFQYLWMGRTLTLALGCQCRRTFVESKFR